MKKRQEHGAEGRLLTLQVRSAGTRTWLGPAWAVLCGAVASGGLELHWQTLVGLLFVVLLADVFLGTVWDLARDDQWSQVRGRKNNPGSDHAVPALPYTLPGSVAHRLLGSFSDRLALWRSTVWPQAGDSILGLGFCGFSALLIGAMLGVVPFLLAVIALGIAGACLALRPKEGVLG